MTKLKIRKIGNSDGVILPKDLMESLGVKEGDSLEVVRTGDGIKLIAANDESDRLMVLAEDIMDRRRDMLRALAK